MAMSIKIKYNAPAVLSFSLLCIVVFVLLSGGIPARYFTSPAGFHWDDGWFYLRLVSYVFGHGSVAHMAGNLTIILLLGPLLEEKYGSFRLSQMMLVTAVITGLLNAGLLHSVIMGASGIAFMFILLGSFSNIGARQIPLTFIIVAALFLGNELTAGLKIDRISQFSHLAGGMTGAVYGFVRKR